MLDVDLTSRLKASKASSRSADEAVNATAKRLEPRCKLYTGGWSPRTELSPVVQDCEVASVVPAESEVLGDADGALVPKVLLVCWLCMRAMYSLYGSGRFGRAPRGYRLGAMTKARSTNIGLI